MIMIAEPVHFGATHRKVNSAFVALFRSVFPQKRVVVHAEEQHIVAIREEAGPLCDGVHFESFQRYSKPGRFYWWQKVTGEGRQVARLLWRCRKEQPELMVWLCLFPSGRLLLALLSFFLCPRQRHLIILHGEMEYLLTGKRLSERLMAQLLRLAFTLDGRNVHYMVLGPQIIASLDVTGIRHPERFLFFPHPYLYRESACSGKPVPPLRVCCFGALNKAKGVSEFFALAQRFAQEVQQGLVQFATIGRLDKDLGPFRNPWVQHIGDDGFMPEDAYVRALAGQDCALFFYGERQYSLSASGALHEAINQRLRVICLPNPYFEALAAQADGITCVPSLHDMESAVRQMTCDRQQGKTDFNAPFAMFIQQNSFLLQSQRLERTLWRAGLLQPDKTQE